MHCAPAVQSKPGRAATCSPCFDGRQDSLVTAAVGPASGVGDPRFKALVRQTVLNLFVPDPRFGRDRDRERERRDR